MAPLLCKDCVHIKPIAFPSTSWLCGHPSSVVQPKLDLVTGAQTKPRILTAGFARTGNHKGSCGPRGQFWEVPADAGQHATEAAS